MHRGADTREALLDRERDLAVLDEHLAAAESGLGRVALLEGPPGIGKTALLGALRAHAQEAGWRWLPARGSEQERDHPFGVVRQLLEPTVLDDGERLFDGAAELARTVVGGAEPPDQVAPDTGFAVLHGLYWLVHNLADRGPAVLVVDDLQWVDVPSLRFLDYLAVRLEGMPVLVALATRAGDASLTIGPIARLADHADVHTVAVGPLTAEAVATWVARELGDGADPRLADACATATGGNPFLLGALLAELAHAAAADPESVRELAPASIVRSVGLRLHALAPEAIALSRAVAVLGDPADSGDAADLAGIDHRAAADAADVLAVAGFFERGRPLRFVHPIVLAAVRESIPGADADGMHRRAARLLAERPGGLDAAAGHLLAADAQGDAGAAELLRRAGLLAMARGAPDLAVTYLRRALAEPPDERLRPEIMVELARAAGLAGDSDALEFAQVAVDGAPGPEMRVIAARELALQHALAGRHARAAAVLDRVLAQAPDAPPEQRLLAEGMLILSATQDAGARRLHGDRIARAVEFARMLGAESPAPLAVMAGFELTVVQGEIEEGCAMVERAVAGGRMLQDASADSPFPFMAAIALLVGGRFAASERTLTDTIADAARRGSMRAFVAGSALRGMERYRRGDLRGAEADARAAFEQHDGHSLMSLAYCTAALCGVLVETGDLEGAEAAIDRVPVAARDPATNLGHIVLDMRARLRLAQGRPADALADLQGAVVYERDMGVRHGCWSAWRAKAAEAHLALGDRERAAALARESLQLARRLGAARAVGLSLRAIGLTSPEPERRGVLAEAVAVLQEGGMVCEHARALLDLADAQAAAGRSTDARATFDAALERAEAAGAGVLAARARDGLVALGARPRRREVTGRAALTPAERRVAELAAHGAANREIAQGLFLTLKTVENHLTSVYRKLGIGSRTQLADQLG